MKYIILIVIIIFIIIFIIYKFYSTKPLILNNKQTKFKKTLEGMADILESVNIPFFLSCGTSLGAHREKKFIEHDLDIDLGIFENISYQKIINNVVKSNKFIIINKWPKNTDVKDLTEVTFGHIKTRVKVDIFKHFKKNNKYLSVAYTGKCDNKPRNRCEWLNPINLISMKFLNRYYMVPDMEYIKSRYGSDWNIPKIQIYYNQESIIN